MNRRILFTIACCLVLYFFSIPFGYGQNSKLTTFILVRHAEKSTNHPDDPDLSQEGFERAKHLAKQLSYTPIDVALSTPYKRTQQTLSPLAVERNLKIIEYSPSETDIMKKFFKKYKGKTILLAGHSNTIPDYVNQLASTNLQQLNEMEYDKIFIVTLKKMGAGKVLTLKD